MFLGLVLSVISGLSIGSAAWTFKAIRRITYENWMFLSIVFMFVLIPWITILSYYPHPLQAIAQIGWPTLVKANLFSICWGFANVLCGIGFLRIGVALSNGVIGSLGISLGVTIPMLYKGSGTFKDAPDIFSAAGVILLLGVGVMLIGVILAAIAGAERHKSTGSPDPRHFWSSIFLVALAGVLSVGLSIVNAYFQYPIAQAFRSPHHQAQFPATMTMYGVGMAGGTLVNIVYCSYLMTVNRTWRNIITGWKEMIIPAAGGLQGIVGLTFFTVGSAMLGALGASVGSGIYQGMQLLGGQMIGFMTGEWKGPCQKPRNKMLAAIAVIFLAAAIMAYGNWVHMSGLHPTNLTVSN